MKTKNKNYNVYLNGKQVIKQNKPYLHLRQGMRCNKCTIACKLCKKPNLKHKTFYFNKKKKRFFWVIVAGLVIGFINGFWGGGGGMVCVPTLSKLLKLPEKKAHATAILVMLPLSIASCVVYFLRNNLQFDTAGYITGGFFAGGIVGALLLKKINNVVLQIIFALIIIVAGVRMLI